MSVEWIDPELCTGCGVCVNSCSMDVIRMDSESNKAIVQYPEDCMLCESCKLDCPENAIFISPDKNSPIMVSWG